MKCVVPLHKRQTPLYRTLVTLQEDKVLWSESYLFTNTKHASKQHLSDSMLIRYCVMCLTCAQCRTPSAPPKNTCHIARWRGIVCCVSPFPIHQTPLCSTLVTLQEDISLCNLFYVHKYLLHVCHTYMQNTSHLRRIRYRAVCRSTQTSVTYTLVTPLHRTSVTL